MPYIKPDRRPHISLISNGPENDGELNYVITEAICEYLKDRGGTNYHNLNGVIGVLECVKQELYRRLVAPYEDYKCRLNGDVFPPQLLNIGE
jgi:hypothetical protein